MNWTDYLLTSSQTSQQFSVCLWDYNTLNVKKYYKNGGIVAPKCLECLGEDYILTAEIGKPILYVWPLNSQEIAKNIRLILPEPPTCLAISPQNNYLAVGISSKLFIWQLSSGKLLSVQHKHFQPITVIKFSSAGDFILVGGQDGMLVAYLLGDIVSIVTNLMQQSEIGQAEPLYVKNDHSMPIRDIHIGYFGGKARFATVSSDQTCRIYSLKYGENLLTLVFTEPLTSIVMDTPGWNFYVGSDSGSIRQFNLRNPPMTSSHHINDQTALTFIGHKKKIVCLAVNTANSILASGSDDNFVYTWEIKSRQILKKIEHKSPITNIKFISDYQNFFVETLKPKIILKTLQRTQDLSDFVVSLLQTEDIEFDDEEKSLHILQENEDLEQENRKLRAINKQVYKAALLLRENYKT